MSLWDWRYVRTDIILLVMNLWCSFGTHQAVVEKCQVENRNRKILQVDSEKKSRMTGSVVPMSRLQLSYIVVFSGRNGLLDRHATRHDYWTSPNSMDPAYSPDCTVAGRDEKTVCGMRGVSPSQEAIALGSESHSPDGVREILRSPGGGNNNPLTASRCDCSAGIVVLMSFHRSG